MSERTPADKPLPPRPILQMADQESPSKGRSLIDASEPPLQTSSPSGVMQEWPSLTPTPAASTTLMPSMRSEAFDQQRSTRQNTAASTTLMPSMRSEAYEQQRSTRQNTAAATSPSVYAASPGFADGPTGTAEGGDSPARYPSLSSGASYKSANESSNADRGTTFAAQMRTSRVSHEFSSPWSTRNLVALPKRAGSVPEKSSRHSFVPQTGGSNRKSMTFQDITQAGAASPDVAESGPPSPSATTFSQPRAASSSYRTPPGSLKAVKTASRMPIAEGKKPSLVDVKPPTSRNSSKSAQQPPTFGNRRLDSKTADILDNGIRRRQLMKRTHAREEVSRPSLARVPTDASDAPTPNTPTTSLGRGSGAWNSAESDDHTAVKSDGELTYAASASEDESEITTPLDRPTRFSKRPEQSTRASDTGFSGAFDDAIEGEASQFHRPPPPTSPFTDHLPTILSQPDLPAQLSDKEKQILRAREHLEGRGSPAKRDVDRKTLERMFGDYRFDHYPPHHTSTFVENAANAERFVNLPEESQPRHENTRAKSPALPARPTTEQPQPSTFASLQPEVSKWSDTTPSDKATSEDANHSPDASTSQEIPEEPAMPAPAPMPMPQPPAASEDSIGHISRTPGTPEALTFSSQIEAADPPTVGRRRSSLTLGGPLPSGSVRAARDGIRAGPAGYARTTQATEARKKSRLPTLNTNVIPQRGRQPSAQKQPLRRESEARPTVSSSAHVRDAADIMQTPRARSRSRYVFDKLNGLFSGKRDKKSSDGAMPVPRTRGAISTADISMPFPMEPAELEGSPAYAANDIPPVPKLPEALLRPSDGLQSQASMASLRHAGYAHIGASASGPAAALAAPADPEVNEHFATIHGVTQSLVETARRETDMRRKEHILHMAEVRLFHPPVLIH